MRNPRAELDRQMGEVLAQLATVSHVPAAGWGPTGRSRSSDEPLGGSRPPGDLGHAFYARWYGPPFHERTREHPGAQTNERRREVLELAQAELDHLKGRTERPKPKGETAAERDDRIVREGEGFTAREVAIRFRCGERDVRKARLDAGREPERGAPIEEKNPDRLERQRRVRELRAKGMPITAIAMQLDIDKATVSRYLKRRDAA